MVHELKTLPIYYEEILNGNKKFELRKFDRPFKVNDKLILKECENDIYTGREIHKIITYVFSNGEFLGLNKNYCILSIENDYFNINR